MGADVRGQEAADDQASKAAAAKGREEVTKKSARGSSVNEKRGTRWEARWQVRN